MADVDWAAIDLGNSFANLYMVQLQQMLASHGRLIISLPHHELSQVLQPISMHVSEEEYPVIVQRICQVISIANAQVLAHQVN